MTGKCTIFDCPTAPAVIMISGCFNLHIQELRYCYFHSWVVSELQEHITTGTRLCGECGQLIQEYLTKTQ
jgi:hypothetical protein